MRALLLLILCIFTLSSAQPWEYAIKFVLEHEAGYCHDGGWESNFGLCSKWYPKINMKTLSRDSAAAIYYRDYWCYMGCQMQADSGFALLIFDSAVLFGQPAASRMLRDCLYDKVSFMYLRYNKIAKIAQDTAKVKYLAGWLKRTYDLQLEICGR